METRDARSMLIGVGLGAAVAYLFDPVSGRGRRTRLRDRAKAKARRAQREAERKEQYLRNAAQGLRSQLKSPGPDDRNPDDLKLEDRIRSTVFGRPDIRDDRLVLEVEHGVVILRGEVDSEEE